MAGIVYIYNKEWLPISAGGYAQRRGGWRAVGQIGERGVDERRVETEIGVERELRRTGAANGVAVPLLLQTDRLVLAEHEFALVADGEAERFARADDAVEMSGAEIVGSEQRER